MRFRRFAQGQVNRAVLTREGAAGKSVNVAKALKILGQQPLALGFLGGERGRRIREFLEQLKINHDFIEVPPETRQCLTILDSPSGKVTELVEESSEIPGTHYEKLLSLTRKHATKSTVVVLSGSITPNGPEDFYCRCTKLAHKAGALVIVDARSSLLLDSLKEQPDLVKPNLEELEATAGIKLKTDRDICNAIRKLAERGAKRVVVTAGERPVMAFDGKEFFKVHPPRIAALNPIGSGDSFTAALALGLSERISLVEACCLACGCGAANAQTLMPAEFDARLARRLSARCKLERI
jgi:1-phosphofructokinase family hexose kinase